MKTDEQIAMQYAVENMDLISSGNASPDGALTDAFLAGIESERSRHNSLRVELQETKDAWDLDTHEWEQELKSERAKHRWVACSERLPEKYEKVLTYMPNRGQLEPGPLTSISWINEDGWCNWWQGQSKLSWGKYVTHWQPLPAAPTEEEAK